MKTPVAMSSHALHVLFLSGRNGLAAQLSAHWTRVLAGGLLVVDAFDTLCTDGTTTLDHAQANLAVVIHTPSDPGPLLPYHCGGRIDWHLEVDVAVDDPADLEKRLFANVRCLLTELGVAPFPSGEARMPRQFPSPVVELPIPQLAAVAGWSSAYEADNRLSA